MNGSNFRAPGSPRRALKRAAAVAVAAAFVAAPVAATAQGAQGSKTTPKPSRAHAKAGHQALLGDPSKCLKRSGLGHIRSLGSGKWQGTIGNEPVSKVNDSVFVVGPYASLASARTAAEHSELVEIAYPGGPFVVSATRASYLSTEASGAAACLASLTEGRYHF